MGGILKFSDLTKFLQLHNSWCEFSLQISYRKNLALGNIHPTATKLIDKSVEYTKS